MSSNSGPYLVEFGGGGKSHWAQAQCLQCNAWLKEMPNHFKKGSYTSEDGNPLYIYYWICLNCGYLNSEMKS